MKLLVLLATVGVCCGAPQLLHPITYTSGATVVHADSLTPAVTRIQEPGIRFHVPKPVQYISPVQYIAPVQVAAVPVPAPVQVATPVQITPYQAPAVVAAPVVVAMAPEPLNAPEPPMPSINEPFVGGQFHAQDEAKQYTFGHWGGPNTRVEEKDSVGRVSGSFAYVNPDGDVQVRKYAAAPGMGFKVAASDLPEDTPAVAIVKSAHAQAHADTRHMIATAAVSSA